MERPTLLLSRIRHLSSVLHVIDAHVELGVGDIIRQVLFSQCHHAQLSHVGYFAPVESSAFDEKNLLVDKIGAWMAAFIESLSSDPGVVNGISFSKSRNGFIKWNPASTKFQAELYVDGVEMKALLEVVGTSGFRVIDAHLIRLIFIRMKRVKELLQLNGKQLDDFKVVRSPFY